MVNSIKLQANIFKVRDVQNVPLRIGKNLFTENQQNLITKYLLKNL